MIAPAGATGRDPRPGPPARVPETVDLWWLDLPLAPSTLAALARRLDGDALARLERISHPGRRQELIAGRALARLCLAARLGCPAEALAFATEARGKPRLAGGPAGAGRLEFNVSHTRDALILAIGQGRRLGVDVELLRPMPRWAAIARRYFSPAERDAIERLPAASREHAFLACWVRKEALLKACGGGIAAGLDRFDVEVDPARAPRLLGSRLDELALGAWQLVEVPAGPRHVACLAVEGGRAVTARWREAPRELRGTHPFPEGGRSP